MVGGDCRLTVVGVRLSADMRRAAQWAIQAGTPAGLILRDALGARLPDGAQVLSMAVDEWEAAGGPRLAPPSPIEWIPAVTESN